MRTCSAVLLLAFLSACMLGPDYKRPVLELPAHFKEAPLPWREAHPKAAAPKGNWWEIFADPALNDLQQQARAHNQNAKAAYARVAQARAVADVSRSAFFPSLTLETTAERSRLSENRATTSSGSTSRTNSTSYNVLLDLDYQLDLWGRLRRLFESAEAQAEAVAAQYENTLLVLQADVAQQYYTLRAYDAEIAALENGVTLRQSELDLVNKRFKGKIASAIDVAQAETLLFSAKSTLLSTQKSRAESEHALSILLGSPPASFSLPPRPLEGSAPPEVPAGLTATLLERRPDIAVAEKTLVARNAEVGAAIGAFFPAISLTGSGGYNSNELRTLFSAHSLVWSVMPGLTAPIFDGGLNAAELKQARAAYDESVAAYRQQLLVAFQQVEDALSNNRLLSEQYDVQQKAVGAANATLHLAEARYSTGVDTYLTVADAEVTALQSQLNLVEIQRQRYLATVSLIVALGGGWQ